MAKNKALICVNNILGLPLVYLGILLLLLHFFLHLSSNILLILALVLEIIGVVGHYWKVKH